MVLLSFCLSAQDNCLNDPDKFEYCYNPHTNLPDYFLSDDYLSSFLGGGGSGSVTSIGYTQPSAGFTISGTNPVTTTGTWVFSLSDDLSALEALSGTGVAVRSASDTWVQRTLTGTSNEIDVTNGSGVSGNPTFGIADDPIMPGTGSMTLPIGTTGERPGSPANGMVRYNSSLGKTEFYESGSWTSYGSGTGTVTSVSSTTTNQLTVATGTTTPALTIVTASVANGETGLATGDQIYDYIAAQSFLTGNQTITLSGDVAGSGATSITATIQANAVEYSMLNNNIISGLTALTTGLASTDEMMISDAGTPKRMDISVLEAYMQSNLTFGSGTVTEVTSSTTNQLTVASGTTTPALSIVTAAVANAETALATGDQIYDFVMGEGFITGNETITLSGDVAGSGATSITATIQANAVEGSMLNNNVISGQAELASGLVSTDEMMVSDAGTVKRMDVSVLEAYMQSNLSFGSGTVTEVTSSTTNQLTVASGTTTPALSIVTAAVSNSETGLATGDQIYDFVMGEGFITGNETITLSGDVAGSGATSITATIQANAVEGSMLNNNVISGQTELASGLVSTDEMMVSDGGTVKRMDVSVLEAYMQSNLTFGSGTVTEVTSSTTNQLTVASGTTTPALSIVTAAVANSETGLATGDQIYDWGVAAFAAIDHDATHITAGSDEIDGDKLDIDWSPSNYTPATTPAEADNADNLTAHLYGIDDAIGSFATTTINNNTNNYVLTATGTANTINGESGLQFDGGDLAIIGAQEWVLSLYNNTDYSGAGEGYSVGMYFNARVNSNDEFSYGAIRTEITDDTFEEHEGLLVFSTAEFGTLEDVAALNDTALTMLSQDGIQVGFRFGWTGQKVDDIETTLTDDDTHLPTSGAVYAAIAGASVGAHASTHITGQSDEIDGDKLNIDFSPTYYTPATTPAEASSLEDLTAHLYGIDDVLSASANWDDAYTHISNNGSDHSFIDQDVTIASAPTFTADNFSSGGGNAIITTTQESNYDDAYTHISSNGSDHSYIDQNVTTTGTPTFSSVTTDRRILDPNPTTYSGDIISVTAGTGGVSQYDLVYVSGNQTVLKSQTDGTFIEAKVVGIAVANIAASSTGYILTNGFITNGSWSFTAGDLVYNTATPGSISSTVPVSGTDTYGQCVGRAMDANTIEFTNGKPCTKL